MAEQEEDIEKKLKDISNKITNNEYEVEKDKNDLFFATEIDTNF